MPKIERIEDGNHALTALRITRRKARRMGESRMVNPSILIRCGCCKERVVIFHKEPTDPLDVNLDTLEINGVLGTIDQWRKIFLPLLGVKAPK